MSVLNSMLLNGQVQLNNGLPSIKNQTTNQVVNTSTSTNITTDFDIFPVGQSVDATNYVYDGQTILMINSTLNPNSNIVKAQYFDPITGQTGTSGSIGFSNWNFDLTATSYLNGSMSASSLMSETTSIYNNLQPFNNTLGTYTLDITNGGLTATYGESSETSFFSLTSQPYVTTAGDFVSTPTYNNVNPNYSTNNSDNFLFTSNFYTQQKNEIIIVQLVFTVSNTSSLNVLGTSTTNTPTVSVIVYNKVISQENLSGLATGKPSKSKVYTAGPIPLQYMQSGSTFNAQTGNYSINNNVPIIIADGYNKLYATLPLIYVPPVQTSIDGTWYGQNLNAGNASAPGYIITGSIPTIPTTGTLLNTTSIDTNQVLFGHFVVGIAYSNDFATYNPGSSIYSEVLIKNIWRSPISIYRSYQAFSVNDMATKLVVVLFGKTLNGGTFLVTNTGTPLSLINNYAVTSLRNFMNIMNAVTTTFDSSTSLVDYFINSNVIEKLNLSGYNIQVLTLQPLLDGGIINPPTVSTCPNMYYMFLSNNNSAGMTIDPTNQIVFGQNISKSYFGLDNSTLCSTGVVTYYNSSLQMLSTDNDYLFANSLYLGNNTLNNQSFYMLMILPEALFNGVPSSLSPNVLSIFSSDESLFYLTATNNTSTQFSSSGYNISTSGTNTTNKVTSSITPNYKINKIVMTVSNIVLL